METTTAELQPPLVERRGELGLAGLRRRYTLAQDLASVMQGVSRQWRDFHARKTSLIGINGPDFYGVCHKITEGDASFDYFCGMDANGLADGFSPLVVPPLRYAVFRHPGTTATLPATYFAIFGRLLPEAGLTPADASRGAPEFVERFDERYDLKTGTGGPEILVPLKD